MSLRKLGILSKTCCTMESLCLEMFSFDVPLQETIGLLGGLISRMSATCVISSVS